jgi:hypothetical protein
LTERQFCSPKVPTFSSEQTGEISSATFADPQQAMVKMPTAFERHRTTWPERFFAAMTLIGLALLVTSSLVLVLVF